MFAITALVNVTAFLAGPILGIAVLFLTSSSLAVIDLISSVVYVFVMPYVGLAIVLLFYDLRQRVGAAEPVRVVTGLPAPSAAG